LSGNTVEELGGPIAVPARTERVLRAYARAHAEDAHWMEATLRFRQAVAREFERLVREGVPAAETPEAEESELALPRRFTPSCNGKAGNAEAGFQGVRGLHFEIVVQRP